MKPSGEQSARHDAWRNRSDNPAYGMRFSAPEQSVLEAQRRGGGASPAPLVDPALLQQSAKILFIAHLALGDFTYLQGCFRALARAYPHLKIHLWVDERRRTSRSSEWAHLKKYALYDWLAECSYID